MSVKFEKETVRTTGPVPGLPDKNGSITHQLGEALTGGKQQTGYLAVSWLVRSYAAIKL
jgi:hypothetical protein